MQEIQVNKIADLGELTNQPSHVIGCNNWPKYGPAPLTSFKIAQLGNEICIMFTVEESSPRAVNKNDQEPVWEDSCVEFFCRVPGDTHYFNFEFNSLGACVSSRRISRKEDVKKLTPDTLARIKRTPVVEDGKWSLLIEIPKDIISSSDFNSLEANLYKCGDRTEHPHFMSWSPIDLPSPDFHCPAFFGKIIFKD